MAEGYGDGDQRRFMGPCGSGRTLALALVAVVNCCLNGWQRCALRATCHALVYSRVSRALGATSSQSAVAPRVSSVLAECVHMSRLRQTSARVKAS